jgi:hypothetical protein
MGVVYRVGGSCVGLVVDFRAFSRNRHPDNIIGTAGPDSTLRVIPIDDVIAPRLVGLADRVQRPPIPEGVDKGRVPRGEARHGLAVRLPVGEFDPAVGEVGHGLIVATGGVGGDGQRDLAARGGHGSILPGSRFAWGARKEIS